MTTAPTLSPQARSLGRGRVLFCTRFLLALGLAQVGRRRARWQWYAVGTAHASN